MQQPSISHYCQKCCAANPLGQDFCLRCGTRLMIVVEPPSARIDSAETTPREEHLLERLSILENTLGRFAERMEQALHLFLRQSESNCSNQALVQSLITILTESGLVDKERLETMWRAEECSRGDQDETASANPQTQKAKARKATRGR